MSKADILEAEEFAKTIIKMASEKGITVAKLSRALKVAEEVARNSVVSKESIESYDFPASHIAENISELFG